MLAHRERFYQSRLIEHAVRSSVQYQDTLQQATSYFAAKGSSLTQAHQQAIDWIRQQVEAQAYMGPHAHCACGRAARAGPAQGQAWRPHSNKPLIITDRRSRTRFRFYADVGEAWETTYGLLSSAMIGRLIGLRGNGLVVARARRLGHRDGRIPPT